MLSKNELVATLIKSLKIDDNIFNYETINDEIECVPNESYIEFYKQVMKEESYGNGLKAILKVAEKYRNENIDKLLAGTREQAKEMYDKFYSESCAMLDYTQKDRNKTPNDREFFKNMPYKELQRTDCTKTYSDKDLYVLGLLGGGEWLLDIRFAQNSNVIITDIENIIKKAVVTKYGEQKTLTNPAVKKMIRA